MKLFPQQRRSLRFLRLVAFVTRRVASKAVSDNISGLAAQMAFYFLLAFFPFVLLLMTLLPFVSEASALESLMPMLRRIFPPETMGYVLANLERILTERREGLLSLSALTLLWSASSGFVATMDGLNVAYKVRESRPIWKARLMAIVLTIGLGVLILTSILLLVFGALLNEMAARYSAYSVIFWAVMRWVVALAFLVLALDIVYYTTPDVRHPWRWFSPGSMVATPAWVGISLGFRYYVSRFGRYEATYGALAAVVLLMLWFYFSAVMLLIGGEVNSVLERELRPHAKLVGASPPEPAVAD